MLWFLISLWGFVLISKRAGWAPHAYFEMLGKTEGTSMVDDYDFHPMLQTKLKSASARSSPDITLYMDKLETGTRY